MIEQSPPGLMSKIIRFAAMIALGLVFVYALGFLVGVSAAALDNGRLTLKTVGLLLGCLAVLGLSGYGFYRLWPRRDREEPVSPKVERTRWSLIAALGLGMAIGVALTIPMLSGESGGVFSNDPIPATTALSIVIAYAVLTPIGSYFWHRNADEFEREASGRGALLGMYAYSVVAPSWWLLERADLVPEQDPMIVFLLVMTVWGVVWQIRRSD
ncbi:hypothetical protein GRI34_05020 [Erythrobacter aquimaris]|uniref:Uncharacterized protein n=1 Tax=Qipengyuania aquimaris TaxID=255984 RepID=A0A6I4TI66_9SPHN|nr:hypothetical protein [Qipengyuania aquimaris]MXO95782.1 hypothetical protein [Qipengyuania aquimaris]